MVRHRRKQGIAISVSQIEYLTHPAASAFISQDERDAWRAVWEDDSDTTTPEQAREAVQRYQRTGSLGSFAEPEERTRKMPRVLLGALTPEERFVRALALHSLKLAMRRSEVDRYHASFAEAISDDALVELTTRRARKARYQCRKLHRVWFALNVEFANRRR